MTRRSRLVNLKLTTPGHLQVSKEVAAAMRQLAVDARGSALPPEVIFQMMSENSFQPGARPKHFCATGGQFIFKETQGTKRRTPEVDTYVHSGGLKVSKDLLVRGQPMIRQRYGRVSIKDAASSTAHHANRKLPYRRYNLLVPSTKAVTSGDRLPWVVPLPLF